jgi:hypothetical protein
MTTHQLALRGAETIAGAERVFSPALVGVGASAPALSREPLERARALWGREVLRRVLHGRWPQKQTTVRSLLSASP